MISRNAIWANSARKGPSGCPMTWTIQPTPFGAFDIYGVTYDNGIWVICGQGGRLATATNPTGVWTSYPTGFTDDLWWSAYGNGVWTLVGRNGLVATTADPTVGPWVQGTSGFEPTGLITEVGYKNGLWIICGSDSSGNAKLCTANDPTTVWTPQVTGFGTSVIGGVDYGNGMWVAVGASGKLETATHPANVWTPRNADFGTNYMDTVYYGADGYWVAGGGNTPTSIKITVATDPTGPWVHQLIASTQPSWMSGVAYGAGAWVGASYNGMLHTATNPLTGPWTERNSHFGLNLCDSVDYGNGYWVVGGWGGKLATAVPGI